MLLPLQPGPFFQYLAPFVNTSLGVFLEQISINFGLCCLMCPKMPPDCLQIAPSWPSWPILIQIGPKLAPRSFKFGPSWPPKKSVFELGKIQLTPSWPKICFWRAQEPLPDAPGRVLGTSWGDPGAKRRSRRPQGCKSGLQELPKWPKIDPKMTPKATPNDPQKILSAFQFWFVCFKYVTHLLT